MFSLMCLLVRTMEGIGAAAFMTASFAIMAHTFPDSVSTVFVSSCAFAYICLWLYLSMKCLRATCLQII